MVVGWFCGSIAREFQELGGFPSLSMVLMFKSTKAIIKSSCQRPVFLAEAQEFCNGP